MKSLLVLLLTAACLLAVDQPEKTVPVAINHAKGSLSGQLAISLGGPAKKVRVEWSGSIRNTSPHRIHRATLCVRSWDQSEKQIRPGGSDCVITLWGTNWEPGAALTFKGKQNIQIPGGNTVVQAGAFTVEATEMFDVSPNQRSIEARCPLVWSSAIKVFADKKFRPTVMDKDSFTATYAYDGGRIDGYGDAKQMLKSFTTASTAFMGPTWESFRIDSASLYLREDDPATCKAEIKMVFAGFGKPLFGTLGWYAVESNFNFEKVILDELEAQSKQAASADLTKAISQLPTALPPPTEAAAKPQLTITSTPPGAEIEIDGEFIGNTPTTISTKTGAVTIKVHKAGHQPWVRTLKLSLGDKRTLNAELQATPAAQP